MMVHMDIDIRAHLEYVLSNYIDTLSYDMNKVMQQVMRVVDQPLMNTADVATYLGRDSVMIRTWLRRNTNGFPSPSGTMVGGIKYWRKDVIQVWAELHPELLGEGTLHPAL